MSTYEAGPATRNLIADLAHQARPDWDPVLLAAILTDLSPRVTGNDLARAVLALADTDLPERAIKWPGPWWRDLASTPPEIEAAVVRCLTCGKPEHRCRTERPGRDDDHPFEPAARRVAS